MLPKPTVASTRRHPNAPLRGEELTSPVSYPLYLCLIPQFTSCDTDPSHTPEWCYPAVAASGAAILHCLPRNTSSEPRGRGRRWNPRLSRLAFDTGQLFFQRHRGGNAKGQHPLSTHLARNGGSEDPSTKQEVKSQEAGQAIWFCRMVGRRGNSGMVINRVRDSVAF